MKSYALLALALVLLVVAQASLAAGEYARVKVKAEIKSILNELKEEDEQPFATTLAAGDRFEGVIQYDVEREGVRDPDANGGRNYNYSDDFNSYMEFRLGGSTIRSFFLQNVEGLNIFYELFSWRTTTASSNKYEMVFSSQRSGIYTESDHILEGGPISIRLKGETAFQTSGLPQQLNLIDWHWRSLRIEYTAPSGRSFKIEAVVRSFSPTERMGDLDDDGVRNEAATISGSIYIDDNGNCSMNAWEGGIANQVVIVRPGPFFAISDNQGNYEIELPPANRYAVGIKPPFGWQAACRDDFKEVGLMHAGRVKEDVNIGMQAARRVQSLDVTLAGDNVRLGFEFRYVVRFHNNGTIPYSGDLVLRYDPLLQFISADPAVTVHKTDELLWHLKELPVGATGKITIVMRAPEDEDLLGYQLCASVWSEQKPQFDELAAAAMDEICLTIRGAYDPNDIQVFAGTKSADGTISLIDTTLTYHIRFQNVGSAPASTVRILDTLDKSLDFASLRLGAASHDYSVRMSGNAVLEWTFSNIELPSQASDEAASRGFVSYKIDRRDALSAGSAIPNRAAIYFDYNSPVITNTVVSTLVSVSTSVNEEESQFKDKELFSGTVVVYNLLGRRLREIRVVERPPAELQLDDVQPGAYFLHYKSESVSRIVPMTIVR